MHEDVVTPIRLLATVDDPLADEYGFYGRSDFCDPDLFAAVEAVGLRLRPLSAETCGAGALAGGRVPFIWSTGTQLSIVFWSAEESVDAATRSGTTILHQDENVYGPWIAVPDAVNLLRTDDKSLEVIQWVSDEIGVSLYSNGDRFGPGDELELLDPLHQLLPDLSAHITERYRLG